MVINEAERACRLPKCGVPREGLEVSREVAEGGGLHCAGCGAVMEVEECSSLGMQQLGMYIAVCPTSQNRRGK